MPPSRFLPTQLAGVLTHDEAEDLRLQIHDYLSETGKAHVRVGLRSGFAPL